LNTKIININSETYSLNDAIVALKNSDIVVFPTETVYGIGANALDKNAVLKIFAVKNRPPDNPLIVHALSLDWIYEYSIVKEKSLLDELFAEFCPGPLTFILDKKSIIPYETTGGLESVAIRVPRHDVALRLIKEFGLPISAPSANISGRPSATSLDMLNELNGKVPIIVYAGESQIGIESTVIDIRKFPPKVLRPGFVTVEELKKVTGRIEIAETSHISPGNKYKHYRINIPVAVFSSIDSAINFIDSKSFSKPFFISTKKIDKFEGYVFNSYLELSKILYRMLYECEKKGYDIVFIEKPSDEGLGFSILNRIKKTSDYYI